MLFLCLSSAENGEEHVANATELDNYLTGIANGDKEALANLYHATSTHVYAFALSILKSTHDAEDVLHDCFVKVFTSAHTYVSNGKPMAWIITITKNLCYGKLQKRKKHAENEVENWHTAFNENEMLNQEDKMVLAACMQHLSSEECNILVLHAVCGFKHREIADMLQLRLPTVLSKYHRSLKKLKELLAKGEDEFDG